MKTDQPNQKTKPIKGIYIHIPFCHSKCAYCSFNSLSSVSEPIKIKYITRLIEEIKEVAKKYRLLTAQNSTSAGIYASEHLQTLYFGGGTPSELSNDQIRQITDCVEDAFEISVHELTERTIEINPFSGKDKNLAELKKIGLNRLSIGIQSFSDRLLKRIGRAHTGADAVNTIELAAEAGFDNISIDLMFGLPEQTLDDVCASLERIKQYPQITHVSAYSLSVEPGTRFDAEYQNHQLELPDEALEREMQAAVNEDLASQGFEHYEISNYAKPGRRAVHNSLYWNMDGYYGFGLGAAGFAGGKRYTNTGSLEDYFTGQTVPKAECYQQSIEEAKGDFMFLGLRQLDGVSDADYRALFGSSFFADYAGQIDRLLKRGLIEKRPQDILALTELGVDLANQVFIEFV